MQGMNSIADIEAAYQHDLFVFNSIESFIGFLAVFCVLIIVGSFMINVLMAYARKGGE